MRVFPPPVPDIVKVLVPVGVASDVVTVRILWAPDVGVSFLGLKDRVAPLGSPDTLRSTEELNPATEVNVTV